MPEMEIGRVTHWFGHLKVAVIEITGSLSVGDTVRFVGHTTDFRQKLDSMQIDRQGISEAKKGDAVGIRIKERVRPHDKVFKIVEQEGETGL